jgi:predicted acylesterase/phospholipase RssA
VSDDRSVQRAERIRRREEDITVAALADLATELRKCRRFDTLAALLIALARRALYEGWAAGEHAALAALLRDNDRFEYARQLYRRELAANEDDIALRQQYAVCIYKDTELPTARRLDRALEVLTEPGPLSQSCSAETLGIAGAIYKRKWEADAKLPDLRKALHWYRCGYKREDDPERWYAGINAAFVLDQLAAAAELEAGDVTPESTALRAEADEVRDKITGALDERQRAGREPDWGAATLAEALLGLGRYEEARTALGRVRAATPEAWKRQTTALQLAALARLRAGHDGFSATSALDTIRELLGPEGGDLSRVYDGKVGLALSGGGFRASLFHLGVLAALAERDVLRHAEALSCVSGGSIVGAFYYLRLRKLLQEKADAAITSQDYADLVDWVSRRFLEGVQRDLRGRLGADFTENVRMMASTNHSRTDRAGQLFEELFFARVTPPSTGPWRVRDLHIGPVGREHGFSPRYENWSRSAKVPVVVFNATTLNTGHNWQFTSSWMGEPPSTIAGDVDGNMRLRRVYYSDAPEAFEDFPLGAAVAASACVPALFPPLKLTGLYDGIDVELVDGGVHDNQGIASLLDQDCSVIVVSDASGQMGDVADPPRNPLRVSLRSNSVLMSRVRRAQYDDLAARLRSGVLRRLAIVHLKKGLPVQAMCWIGCQEADDAVSQEVPNQHVHAERDYEINEQMQRLLAGLRTDLDAFSDNEACRLMAAGYKMARHEISVALPDLCAPDRVTPPGGWVFDGTVDGLKNKPDDDLDTEIASGGSRFFRKFVGWRHRRAKRGPGWLRRHVPGGAVSKAEDAAGRYVATPAKAALGSPFALAGAIATRLRLRLRGRDD